MDLLDQIGGIGGVIVGLIALAFILSWIFLPYAVWTMSSQIESMGVEAKETNRLLRKLVAQQSDAALADLAPVFPDDTSKNLDH